MIADLQEAVTPGEEYAQLLSFLYACPVGLLEIAADGAIRMVNPMAMQLLFKLSPVPSLNFLHVTEGCAPEIRNLMAAFTAAQGTVCEQHRIVATPVQAEDTTYEVLSCTIVKLGPDRLMIALSDISHQVRLERKLNVAESWFASLLEDNQDFGVASLDKAGRICSVSPAISRQTGFAEAEMLGKDLQSFEDATTMDDERSAAKQLAIATREGWHLHENWHRHKDGSKVWYQRLVAVRHSPEQENDEDAASGYTVILREGKPHSVDMHKLKYMLTRDHLTGAYNRMHLFEALEKEAARKRRYSHPVALVMIDVDHFKQVNDRYGHVAGDQVLRDFARGCMALLRPVDTMARMGGEEFAILMPSTDLQGAAHLAERLREATEALSIQLGQSTLKITASFGCSELTPACDITHLLSEADAALYQAKRAGRNTVILHGATS